LKELDANITPKVDQALSLAASDPAHVDTGGIPLYLAFELSWVDRFNDIYSAGERTTIMDSLILQNPLTPDNDVFDARVAVEASSWLMPDNADTQAAVQGIIDNQAEQLCQNIPSDYYSWTGLLAISGFAGITHPCPEYAASNWEAIMTTAMNESDKTAAANLFDATTYLDLLDLAQRASWPNDTSKEQEVLALLNNCLSTASTVSQGGQYPDWESLQRVAFRHNISLNLSDSTQQALAEAVGSTGPGLIENAAGVNAGVPLSDAIRLGAHLTIPEGFPEGMPTVEQLSVAIGRGTSWKPSTESLIASLAPDATPQTVSDLITPHLLAAVPNSCTSTGLPLVKQYVRQHESPQADNEFGALAQAVRLLESCGHSDLSRLSSELLDLAFQVPKPDGSQATLTIWWQAQTVLCSLSPEEAKVGDSAWPLLEPYLPETGGASDDRGYITLEVTHEAISLLTTTIASCQRTGILGG
jgi:hypothetical protein